jgi:hypothetical protein
MGMGFFIRSITRKLFHCNQIKEGARVAQSIEEIGYGLDYRGSIPGKGNDRNFFLRHRVQIGSGIHPAFYSMGIGGFL